MTLLPQTYYGVIRGMGPMDASLNTPTLGAGTSAMIGKLMVRLRADGLLSAEGTDAILRNALAHVAPPRPATKSYAELFADAGSHDVDGLFAAA